MDDVVPGALQRLREADIISMAGLTGASLGQEFCRIGAVHTTKRQGAWLTGIVDVPSMVYKEAASPSIGADEAEQATTSPGHYLVEIEVRDPGSWNATCTCVRYPGHLPLCPHAAALLYEWLAHPMDFLTPSSSSPSFPVSISSSSAAPISTAFPLKNEGAELQIGDQRNSAPILGSHLANDAGASTATQSGEVQSSIRPTNDAGASTFGQAVRKEKVSLLSKQVRPAGLGQPAGPPPFRGAAPGNLDEILALLGLSELRNIAREYDITTNGLSKQQLLEKLLETLKQPEMIRRAVGMLEKPQRQLLAALALAGGSMTDDDVRSLFERFSLGTPSQLQGMLSALQSKALVFHTSVNSSLQQRLGLGGSLFDVGWHVPTEVRSALHVTLPITPFDVETGRDQGSNVPLIAQAEPYSFLADLLVVARALDGYRLESNDVGNEQQLGEVSLASRQSGRLLTLSPHTPPADGSIAIPPPGGVHSLSLLESIQNVVPRTPVFLRFAIRLLLLADILYKDDTKTAYLHVLPNAARLLLGSTRAEVARELFTQWLTQATYEELFDLQEEGLHLRCRATPLNQPALRPGELETENSEARQSLVALLAQAPLNQWINFSAFARFVYRLNPTFLQRRQRLFSFPHWWLELEEGRPLHPTQLSDWLRAEGRYLVQLVQGPLHWWGATDIATSDNGHLLAFRLTPMAGLLLNGVPFDKQTPEQQDRQALPMLEVSQTGNVLITCSSAAWPLIELLENFAEVAGVSDGRLRYRLTAKSLGEAFSRGLDLADLLERLRSVVEDHQQGVADLLVALERRLANYGRVRLYTDGLLLEVADTQVKRELSATTSLDKQVVRTISPTLFMLKKQGAERLLEELKRRGQAPLLHEEESHGTE